MKILALMKNSDEKAARTGMFTTGMVSIVEDHRISLFFTGQKHAGENMLGIPGTPYLIIEHDQSQATIEGCFSLKVRGGSVYCRLKPVRSFRIVRNGLKQFFVGFRVKIARHRPKFSLIRAKT